MNKKEQRIIEAFNKCGLSIAKLRKEELKKLLKNGTFTFFELAKCLPESKFNSFFIEQYFNRVEGSLYQPKELEGIENNNGWIRIDSESILPEGTIECRTCFYDGVNFTQKHTGERNAEQLWDAYKTNQITHYQPLDEVKFPIY